MRLFVLAECPSVQQLHSEMEEMQMLLNASRQQYDDRLQLVQRHTVDTKRWLGNMDDKYGWVSQLSNSTVGPRNIFSVITVCNVGFVRLYLAVFNLIWDVMKAAKSQVNFNISLRLINQQGLQLILPETRGFLCQRAFKIILLFEFCHR